MVAQVPGEVKVDAARVGERQAAHNPVVNDHLHNHNMRTCVQCAVRAGMYMFLGWVELLAKLPWVV